MRLRAIITSAVIGISAFFLSNAAANPGAWWEICDTCLSDADFRSEALAVPISYTDVYVSNTNTNQTQQFQRSVTVQEMGGTMFITIDAVRVIIPPSKGSAFEETINNSKRTYLPIDRGDLDHAISGGNSDSIVGDLQTGRVSTALLTAIQYKLIQGNFNGHIDSLSTRIAHSINILSQGKVIVEESYLRKNPIIIKINYSNGSSLMVTLSPDLEEFSLITLEDDLGQPIPLIDSNDPSSLIDLHGFSHDFISLNQIYLDNLLRNLDGRNGYECRSEVTDDRVTVICSQSL